MMFEVYSGFVCPWCYMGHRRLRQVLSQLAYKPKVRWRSFQLAPDESTVPSVSAAEAMLGWYPSREVAEERISQIVQAGKKMGLTLRLDAARPVKTFDAHRLSHLAAEQDRVEDLHERIFSAYHSEGRNIANHGVLFDLASSAGLDEAEVRRTLDSERFGAEVRADMTKARTLGVRGVPKLISDNGLQISPNDELLASHLLAERG